MEEEKKEVVAEEVTESSVVEVGNLVGVPELEEKPTEIDVEKPEVSEEDVDEVPQPPKLELAETTKNPKVREKYNLVIQESNKHFLEKVKDESFDINNIEFEEDGVTPVVTDEDLRVFAALSDEYIGDMDLDTYVQLARENIMDYANQKKEMEAGNLDEDDLEYFEQTAKSYEESRLFMASIQHECRKLKKDFEESTILEDTIKSMVYDNLYTYIVNKFKLSDSWVKKTVTDKDVEANVKRISNSVSKHMFVPSMFQEWINREKYKLDKECTERYKFNLFNPKQFDRLLNNVVFTIEHYIKNSNTEPSHLVIEKILDKDLMNLNFVNPILMYAFKDNILNNKKLNPEQLKKVEDNFKEFESVLVPTEDCKGAMSATPGMIDLLLKFFVPDEKRSLDDVKLMTDTFTKAAIKCFESDVLFKQFLKDNKYESAADVDYTDVKGMYLKLADIIPNIEDTTIRKWGLSFKFSQKYYFIQHFIDYRKDLDKITDVDELKMSAFNNIIVPVAQLVYLLMYADIITDICDDVIKNYGKENRSVIFGTFINHFIFEHELSFKTPILDPSIFDFKKKKDENGNETDEVDRTPLVDLMHKVFGKNYKYMCSEPDDPAFEYSNYDIRDTRKEYISIVQNLLYDYIFRNFETVINENAYFNDYLKACELKQKAIKNNKKKSKKRCR